MRRYTLGVSLLLLVAVVLLIIHSNKTARIKPCSYSPVLPKLGDQAVIDLYIVRPGRYKPTHNDPYPMLEDSDYQAIPLCIKCVHSDGSKCYFEVYFYLKNKRGKLAYTVAVDYATNELRRQTILKDSTGKKILLGQLVNGMPVPFYYFLTFPKSYLNESVDKYQSMEGGLNARITRDDRVKDDDFWRTSVWIRHENDTKERILQWQNWRSGQWIWERSAGRRNGDASWHAERRFITSAKH